MHLRRRMLIAALALMSLTVVRDSGAAAQAPRIGRPRPPPPGPPDVPPLPPAVIDNELAVGGDDVKAKLVSTRLSVAVRVNGRGPYNFVVDSGADTSVVGHRIARDLQLPLGTPVVLNGMTARHLVDRVRVAELTLGPSTIRNLQLPALREVDLGGAGLIGIDALVQQRLMMDFEKRLIKVEDAQRPAKSLPGDIVIVAQRRRGQLILTQVRAGGLRLEAEIDTGTEITIGNLALRDRLIRKRAKFWTIEATGVTGVTVPLQVTLVRELQLGPITLQNVPIAFADVPPFALFGLSEQPSLLLGTDILETFRRVSLDFRSRKVRFQLRRCHDSVSISTSPTVMATRLWTNSGPQVCGR